MTGLRKSEEKAKETMRQIAATASSIILLTCISNAIADPCGMVPPISRGGGTAPLVRSGDQQTYVFFKDGIESFVIRPGYKGKVEEFGMLIPFPTPPALRKVSDDIFPHIAAAVDPPEVVVYAGIARGMGFGGGAVRRSLTVKQSIVSEDKVEVIKREAVGMYDVVVLEAGSAEALKKWMDENGFRFPEGMEPVCQQYIAEKWCFVAVKTKVSDKSSVEPQPGQRQVRPGLPSGASFDGHVQAMGFRFKTDKLVVPMRLSAFNGGDLRNIVYLLTEGPKRIRNIPDEYVVRQITGSQLLSNLTSPLPLRIIGGTEKDLAEFRRQSIRIQRDPKPKNGAARQLFAADLVSVATGKLSLDQEETEKQLLKIGERLGLRGKQIDELNREQMQLVVEATNQRAMDLLKGMTLTVVDGDFPREVLAGENLTFAEYRMPASKNNPATYNAMKKGTPQKQPIPAGQKSTLIRGALGAVPKQQRTPSFRFGLCATLFGVGLIFCQQNKRYESNVAGHSRS